MRSTITILLIYLCVLYTGYSQPNLVQNGDFSQGNVGFTSGYTFNANSLLNEGFYSIVSNATVVHSAFVGHDHTTGSGLFMAVNGAGTPGKNVWCQTVAVTPNTDYNFTTFVSSLVASSPAILQFSINGVQLGNTFQAPGNINNWLPFHIVWYSGNNTSANICIVNQNTNGNGNDFGLDDITFTKYCSVSALAQPVNPICVGSSVQLLASGGATYAWTPTTGLSNPSIANPIASPSVTTKYQVAVSAKNCTDNAFVTVVVNTYPIANAGIDKFICLGESTALGGVPTAGLVYSWSPTIGLSNPAIANPSATPPSTTRYILAVSNSGCVRYDTVVVNVNNLAASIREDTLRICPGSALKFHGVHSGGRPPYTYQWSAVNASGIVGSATSDSLTIKHDLPGTYQYNFTVTDSSGCKSSKLVTAVYYQPPVITPFSTIFGCSGERTTITAVVNQGKPPYKYSWQALNSASVSIIQSINAGEIIVATPTDTTYTFKLLVTDANGCQDSATINYTVVPKPLITNAAANPVVTCLEANRPPTTIGDKITITGGVPPYTYEWKEAGGGNSTILGSKTTLQTEVKPDITTNYILTVTDINPNKKCGFTYTLVVEVRPVPDAPPSTDQILCACDPTSIAQLGGEAKCGVPPYQYEWSPTTGLSNPTSVTTARTTAKPAQTTTYTLKVTDGQARIAFDTVVVTVVPCPTVTGDTVVVCDVSQPHSLGVTVSGVPTDGLQYDWSPLEGLNARDIQNPTLTLPDSNSTRTYTVSIHDKFGCPGMAQVVVKTSKTMNVTTTSSKPCPQKICRGIDSVTLSATVLGGQPPYTISWTSSQPVVDFPKKGTSVFARPLETTTFTALITDANGCTSQSTIDVCVDPVPNVNPGNPDTICTGASITVGKPSTCGEKFIYNWASNPFLVQQDTRKPEAIFTPTSPGTYTLSLTVQDQDGGAQSKSTTGTVTIVARENPKTLFKPQQSLLCECSLDGSELHAIGSQGKAPYTFIWTENGTEVQRDGGVDSSVLSLRTLIKSTTYRVRILDAYGCESTDSSTVTLLPCPIVTVESPIICECESVQLAVNVTGNPNDYTYKWTNADGTSVQNFSDSTVSNPTVTPKITTNYKLATTNKTTGCVTTVLSSIFVGKDKSRTASFTIPSLMSDPRNKQLQIPIVVSEFTPNFNCFPKELQFSLSYNENLFDPNPSVEIGSVGGIVGSIISNTTSTQNGIVIRTIVVRCSPILQLFPGDVLLTIKGAALIGNPGFTDLLLSNFEWVCGSTITTTDTSTGRLTLDSLCLLPNGTKRLLTFNSGASVVAMVPNPTNGTCSLSLKRYNGEEVHVAIYSAIGNEIYSTVWLASAATGEELKTYPITLEQLSGVYHVVIRTANGVSTEQLIIVQ